MFITVTKLRYPQDKIIVNSDHILDIEDRHISKYKDVKYKSKEFYFFGEEVEKTKNVYSGREIEGCNITTTQQTMKRAGDRIYRTNLTFSIKETKEEIMEMLKWY